MPLLAVALPDQPFPSAKLAASHPAAVESSWTPLRMPNGERIALAGGSYLLAFNEEWGFGPSVYGAAKGNFGGLFTAGFTAQRRWRLRQRLWRGCARTLEALAPAAAAAPAAGGW